MSKKFILIILLSILLFNSNSLAENNRYFDFDKGIITLMYHRFNENKYPSTNIQMNVFKEQINTIKNLKINFFDPKNLSDEVLKIHKKKKILLTVDDGFQSFYKNAWPYLKEQNIPLILFISTKDVGKTGYMNWNQINELKNSGLVVIGNHSHTHSYLSDKSNEEIINDIIKSNNLFKENLGILPKYFSYPFGEYSDNFKKIIKELDFKLAFGQHSGVVDKTKDIFELPRFPINEKYGNLERFKFILNLLPLPYKKLTPSDKYIVEKENPPEVFVTFFDEQKNLKNITCYSNEGNRWRKSETFFVNLNQLKIIIREKFITERGRINCSLNDINGWRWFGIQFVISKY